MKKPTEASYSKLTQADFVRLVDWLRGTHPDQRQRPLQAVAQDAGATLGLRLSGEQVRRAATAARLEVGVPSLVAAAKAKAANGQSVTARLDALEERLAQLERALGVAQET